MKKISKFERFAVRFLMVSVIVFVLGIITINSIKSSNVRREQEIITAIKKTKSEIDTLNMQKKEKVSFNRLSTIASNNGYTYQNDAVASNTVSR